jgi:uncharacterized membrane protein YraQ (UPF0718 family)
MTFTLITALVISIIINVALGLYSTSAAKRIYVVSSNLNSIQEEIASFREHLESIYELETFYGDETLKSLLDHSRDMSLEIGKYESIYDLVIDAEENDLLDDKEALNEEETETE